MSARGGPSWRRLSAIVTSGAKCARCGSREDLVAHHKHPRRLGGADELENLEALCRRCHPTVEQADAAEAELVWERPEREGTGRPRARAPRIKRPY